LSKPSSRATRCKRCGIPSDTSPVIVEADPVKSLCRRQRIEELSRILSQHPDKRGKFDELVAHIDPALSVFLKRALANRMPRQGSESPAVSHVASPHSPSAAAAARTPLSPSQPSRLASSQSLAPADEDISDEVD
jgi:hypothetical protein